MNNNQHDRVLVLHGPNLNMLGVRETEYYGDFRLEHLNELIIQKGQECGLKIEVRQSNCEAEAVEIIQASTGRVCGLIINPAGFGYSSISLRDAVLASKLPTVEVHLSNIQKREKFRHRTVISDIAIGQISGFKEFSYLLAIDALNSWLRK